MTFEEQMKFEVFFNGMIKLIKEGTNLISILNTILK